MKCVCEKREHVIGVPGKIGAIGYVQMSAA